MRFNYTRWFKYAILLPFVTLVIILGVLSIREGSPVFLVVSVLLSGAVITGHRLPKLFSSFQTIRELRKYENIQEAEELDSSEKAAVSGIIDGTKTTKTKKTPVEGTEKTFFVYRIEKRTPPNDSFVPVTEGVHRPTRLPVTLDHEGVGLNVENTEVLFVEKTVNSSGILNKNTQTALNSIQSGQYSSIAEILYEFDSSHYSLPEMNNAEQYQLTEVVPDSDEVFFLGSFEEQSPAVYRVVSEKLFVGDGSFGSYYNNKKQQHTKNKIITAVGGVATVLLLSIILIPALF